MSSPIHFQEPTLEELSFEFVSFPFTESQPNSVTSSSTIIHIPLPISVVPPPFSSPTTGIHFTPAQGSVNQCINMVVSAFLMNRYAPLNLPQPMNAMPQEYLKFLPRFTGEDEIIVEQHLPLFYTFVEKFNVEHLDVVMRLFVHPLSGEARKWFQGLPNGSINDWDGLEIQFIQRWGEKRDHVYSLTKFNAIKKKSNESMSDFVKIFNKLYNSLPMEMKPPPIGARVVFAGAFASYFSFTLREIRASTLEQIKTDALEIEANMTVARKVQDKGKAKEEDSSQDQRIDDMTKVIKNLSNKLLKLELDNKKPAQQNRGVSIPNSENSPYRFYREKEKMKIKSKHLYI